MQWQDFWAAFADAENTLAKADEIANQMARILVRRLRRVDGYLLENLKRELRSYNMQTGEWKL